MLLHWFVWLFESSRDEEEPSCKSLSECDPCLKKNTLGGEQQTKTIFFFSDRTTEQQAASNLHNLLSFCKTGKWSLKRTRSRSFCLQCDSIWRSISIFGYFCSYCQLTLSKNLAIWNTRDQDRYRFLSATAFDDQFPFLAIFIAIADLLRTEIWPFETDEIKTEIVSSSVRLHLTINIHFWLL